MANRSFSVSLDMNEGAVSLDDRYDLSLQMLLLMLQGKRAAGQDHRTGSRPTRRCAGSMFQRRGVPGHTFGVATWEKFDYTGLWSCTDCTDDSFKKSHPPRHGAKFICDHPKFESDAAGFQDREKRFVDYVQKRPDSQVARPGQLAFVVGIKVKSAPPAVPARIVRQRNVTMTPLKLIDSAQGADCPVN